MKEETSIKSANFIRGERVALADTLRREGRFDEAREVLDEERRSLDPWDSEGALDCAVARSKVERSAGALDRALAILMEASPLAESCGSDDLRARFHHGLGATYQRLGLADRAWVEYTAAAHYWALAGRPYDAGCADNNVALLVAPYDRARAYRHLESARGHFSGMPVKLAEVDETEARIRLGVKESGAALDLALGAVRVFRRAGETALLLDALPTLIKAAADYQAELAGDGAGGGD